MTIKNGLPGYSGKSMSIMNNKFIRAMALTNVVQMPKRKIFTFWETKFHYYCISGMDYETIVREGELTCAKPDIILPDSLQETFSGFVEDAREFAELNFEKDLRQLRILGYKFQNRLISEKKLGEEYYKVTDKLMESQTSPDVAILNAPNDIWNLALLKVSFETIKKSVTTNIHDLEERDYFLTPEEKKKKEIAILFEEASQNKAYLKELGTKLQEYGFFEEYEDRFYSLVRG